MSTDTVTEWATVILAVAALGALGVGMFQAQAARRALASAADGVEESRRSRIDARAPRVVAWAVTPPVWPAAQKQSLVTPIRHTLSMNDRFELPGKADRLLLLTAYVMLHNEGRGSAFLELPPGAIGVARPNERPGEEGEEIIRWMRGESMQVRLGPGEDHWFLLEHGRTVQEWVGLWQHFGGTLVYDTAGPLLPGVRFTFEITDQMTESIRDELVVDVVGFPIVPIDEDASGWQAQTFVRMTLDEIAQTRVVGTTRRYLGALSGRGWRSRRGPGRRRLRCCGVGRRASG